MKAMVVNDFYCVFCGNKGIPCVRKKNCEREPGHLKKLYCLYCNKPTNHVEIRSILDGKYTLNDFKNELLFHNFDEQGNRINSIGEIRRRIYNE